MKKDINYIIVVEADSICKPLNIHIVQFSYIPMSVITGNYTPTHTSHVHLFLDLLFRNVFVK